MFRNYCRNIDGEAAPWCYIDDPRTTERYEYCDIRNCPLRHVLYYLLFLTCSLANVFTCYISDVFFRQTLHPKRNVRTLIKERNTEEQKAPPNLDEHVKPGGLRLLTHTVIFPQMNVLMVRIYFIIEENFQKY